MSQASPHPDLEPTLRLGISSCLLGEEVRHDGGHKRDNFLIHNLGQWVDWCQVCPELEMGLGVPREAMRLVGTVEEPRLITIKGGLDHTDGMVRWSREKLEELGEMDLDGFVLKKNSPSCGLFRVKVYDKNTIPSRTGRGLFATELTQALPLLPVEEEGRLCDPRLRENFVERIFAYHRLKGMLAGDTAPKDLVAFHTAHKLTLMSHDPKAPSRLGRLVARAGSGDLSELLGEYGRLFMESLQMMASPRRHANVMEHMMGFLKNVLRPVEKEELLDLIHNYRTGGLPLVVPLTLLKHHFRVHHVPDWIHRQVYLNPYPRELMLRNNL